MEGQQVRDDCPRVIPVAMLPRLSPDFVASLKAVGEVKNGLLWLSGAAWAQCQNKPVIDPAVAAHVAKQQAGCRGCGDPGIER
jgi:hypothetical protein